jgi:hypothetical protein
MIVGPTLTLDATSNGAYRWAVNPTDHPESVSQVQKLDEGPPFLKMKDIPCRAILSGHLEIFHPGAPLCLTPQLHNILKI